MVKALRTLKGSLGTALRQEEFEGRKYTVVPVVALVEGVIFPLKAESYELVTAEVYSKAPAGWNGRPLFYGHPLRDGQPVSGNTPEILESEAVGIVFNAGLKDEKLVMEAWIDNEAAEKKAPGLLQRIEDGDDIEISIGALVEYEDETGEYKGTKYTTRWTTIVPDHLALLEEGDTGACSRRAGCGVRAAKQGAGMEKNRLSALVSRVVSFVSGQSASDMSDNDLRQKLTDATRAVDSRVYWVEAVYPDKNEFVYPIYDGNNSKLYRRSYTLAEDGKVTVGNAATEVTFVGSYEAVGNTEVTAASAAPTTSAKAACSCGGSNHAAEEKINMERKEKVSALIAAGKGFTEADRAMLEGASDVAFDTIEKALNTPAAPATPAPAATPAPVAAAAAAPAAPKAMTEAEALAAFPRIASLVSRQETQDATAKAGLITKIVAATKEYTEDELKALEVGQLERIARTVTSATDFSGQAPRGGDAQVVPAPPDLAAALKAAGKGGKQ